MCKNVAIIVVPNGFAIVFHGLQALVSFADDLAQVAIEAEDKAKDTDVEPDEMVVFYNCTSRQVLRKGAFMSRVRQFAKTGSEIDMLKTHAKKDMERKAEDAPE